MGRLSQKHKTLAALAYLLGPFSALFLLVYLKKDKFVKFHALQSLIFFGSLWLFYVILSLSLVGWLILPFLFLISFLIWLF